MNIVMFEVNPFQMNCYIYYNTDTKEGVIFDPAVYGIREENLLKEFIETNSIKITHIINTHGHIDHILGNKFAKECFDAPIYINEKDMFMYERVSEIGNTYGTEVEKQPLPDEYITENTVIKIGDTELCFIETPGHSPGSVCTIDYGMKNVFCGDLIFKNSVGRTDLPGGDFDVLITSVQKLFNTVGNEYKLLPGHMDVTSVLDEKLHNPFLKK